MIEPTKEGVAHLFYWMKERHSIWTKRQAGKPKPWTQDPILQRYRFCCPYRENDRVTIWIRQHIREPFADNPNLWLMLALARRINWPDTLAELIADKKAWPVKKYDPEAVIRVLDARTARKEQVYTGAFMITAEQEIGVTKSKATAISSIGRLWEAREYISAKLRAGTLHEGYLAVQGRGFAWGPFMTGQLIADLKFCPTWLVNAGPGTRGDWWTWAIMGPGSARGLNVVCGRDPDTKWKGDEWNRALSELQPQIDRLVAKAKMPRVSAQDLQNCLCELFKHTRGSSRSKYPGV